MRVGRMLIGILLAWAAVSLLGASAAPADVLCEKKPQIVEGVETCPSPYPVESELLASDSEALFSGGFNVKCKSTLVMKTSKNLGAGKGLAASIPKLTFSGCSGSCSTASVVGLPYGVVISATGGGEGIVTYDSSSDVTLAGCTMFKVTCSYDSSVRVVQAVDRLGQAPTHIWDKGWRYVPQSEEGALCPEELTLTEDYEIEQPKGEVFVSKS